MKGLENSNLKKVLVVTTKEFPLEDVLQVVVDCHIILCLFELFYYLPQNLEKVHPSLVFQISAFTLDIIHVMSNLVLVTTKSSTEPVKAIFKDVLRRIETHEVRNKFETCNSLACISVNKLDLLLDFNELNRSLKELKHTLYAVCLLVLLIRRFAFALFGVCTCL